MVDGHGTLVVGLAQHRVGADHLPEFVHVEDAVAFLDEVLAHALNVLGEGADVDSDIDDFFPLTGH